jgi:MFS family permease
MPCHIARSVFWLNFQPPWKADRRVPLQLKTVFASPWRAVPVLGLTQILTWGTLFYPPVLTVPLIAAERGWPVSFAMGGFSVGLLTGGLVAPKVGRSIDRIGGNLVMACGSLGGAVGLVAQATLAHPVAYFITWMVLGAAMAANLYDPAFATLGRIFGSGARRPITLITFAGGFASTVSWPATLFLLGLVGWRGTYFVYAAVLTFVAAPLHAFALPRERADPHAPRAAHAIDFGPTIRPEGLTFIILIAAFTFYAFIPSALSSQLLAIFRRGGLDAEVAVAIGALFGPAQVLIRLAEFIFGSHYHPLNIARAALTLLLCAFAMLLLSGISIAAAGLFAILFGMSNGLLTLTRGSVPLALYGPHGYGAVVGRIAGPSLVAQAAAPFVVAFIAEHVSDIGALAFVALIGCIALACFLAVRRPLPAH